MNKIYYSSGFKHPLPNYLTGKEIQDLMYYPGSPTKQEELLNKIYKEIPDETKRYPIMVKFLLFGGALKDDVKKRFERYLTNLQKIQTTIVCSLLDISKSLPITDDLLKYMELLEHAYQLNYNT